MMSAAQPRPRLFYGWIIVAATSLVGFVITMMLGANVGVFIKPMGDELGIGTAPFGWAQTARLAGFALSGLVIGRALDRFGPRIPLAVAGLIMGGATMLLGAAQTGWHIVILFAVVGLVGLQGGANLYTSVPIARWFIRQRGRAMAWAFAGVPIGIGVSGPTTQWLVDAFGWRAAWALLGAVGGGLIVLIAIVILRKQPEDMGHLPDGAAAAPSRPAPGAMPSRGDEHPWTRQEATRRPVFWTLAVVFGLLTFCTSTISSFRIPYFVERGIDPAVASFSLVADAIASSTIAISAGFMLDKLNPRHVGAAAFLALVGCFVTALLTTNVWMMTLCMLLFGTGIATGQVLQNHMWPAYFGRANLGSIRGAAMPATLAISALGAPLSGTLRDLTGDYVLTWFIAMGACAAAAGAILLARKPSPRPADGPSTPPVLGPA